MRAVLPALAFVLHPANSLHETDVSFMVNPLNSPAATRERDPRTWTPAKVSSKGRAGIPVKGTAGTPAKAAGKGSPGIPAKALGRTGTAGTPAKASSKGKAGIPANALGPKGKAGTAADALGEGRASHVVHGGPQKTDGGAHPQGSLNFAAAGHASRSPTTAPKPHILYILVDDWGWGDAGYRWPQGVAANGIKTPAIDALVKEGVELNRHYAFKVCSPTRSAVQSGRNPIYVNALNVDHDYWNEADPISGFSGIPRNMTGIAQKMAQGGYETHFYGKWDAGMATKDHTPHGRGYQHALSYWGHGNGYWSHESGRQCDDQKVKDLWGLAGPPQQKDLNPGTCTQQEQEGCLYEEDMFRNRVLNAIKNRNNNPLFIFWSLHLVHDPYELPDKVLQQWSHVDSKVHQFYYGMVQFMDEEVKMVTQTLKNEGIWSNTLIIFHSDNGGDVTREGEGDNTDHGANNYPLKGGKNTNWEGGIRVNAFVSGGYLPQSVRGTKSEGLIASWDWYATLAHLAGVDPTDSVAAKAGLPPVDSINQWPLITQNAVQHPRKTLVIGDSRLDDAWVGGYISGNYKVLVGRQGQAAWNAAEGPSFVDRVNIKDKVEFCGLRPETGCLYDVVDDPEERVNLATQKPEIFGMMLEQVIRFNETIFRPDRGQSHPRACEKALQDHQGFWGPFVQ